MSDLMKSGLAIYQVGSGPVVSFAAQELQKYLQRMTRMDIPVNVCPAYDPAVRDGIWLGLIEELNGPPADITGSDFDDSIWVDINGGRGRIMGINNRSVLLAVYRFLNAAGCRWVRPTADGEYVPSCNLASLEAHLAEKPSYRHRAICIEGAVSLENVLDMIDWSAKVGFSGYFIQFREGHTFFDRWYSHALNPLKTPEKITVEQAREFTRQIESELVRRGMIYHAIGHGWTCEAFGISGLGWDPVIQDWPAEVLDSLALVDGKRAMWNDIPLITSLCFSKAEVRRKVVSCVVEYLETHRNIQALHFWLDDGFNNKCECEDCRAMLPSDFYVLLLNELDAALTASNFTEKVVFLCYADMLWAPERERLANPDRFIFMFAPITRSYRKPLFPQDLNYPQPPFNRNKLVFSNNNDEQLSFLRAWQAVFAGDSFIFDYHLMQPGTYTNDPDPTFLARLLNTDIKNLRRLKLNGMVSCQLQRIFFPTGLAMYVMGRTLWDDNLDFEALLDEYLAGAFGADWKRCKAYLLELSKLQDVVPLREKQLPLDSDWAAKLAQGQEIILGFLPVIQQNLGLPEACHARSWHYLNIHSEIMLQYLPLLAARAQGDGTEIARLWQQLKQYLCQAEDDIQPVLDVYFFINAYEAFFLGESQDAV